MKKVLLYVCSGLLLGFGVESANAALIVSISSPQIAAQKVLVRVGMENRFTCQIKSARAAIFLIDENGKVVGQATKWVIGGAENQPGLAAGATNLYHFVVPWNRPLMSTNLSARIQFNRVVLADGKLADVTKDVKIESSGQ